MNSSKNKHETTNLPLARVRTIMKSSPDVDSIAVEASTLIGRATELFVQHLAESAWKQSGKKGLISYNDLADVIQNNQNTEFLSDIIPHKITVAEYYKKIKSKKANTSHEENEEPDQ